VASGFSSPTDEESIRVNPPDRHETLKGGFVFVDTPIGQAAIRLGLREQAERRKRKEDKHRGLREALEELASDLPHPF
jgi:hypothetical protein